MPEYLKIALCVVLAIIYLGLKFYLRYVLRIKEVSSLSNLQALRRSKFFILWLGLLLVLLIMIALVLLNKIDQSFLIVYVFGLNIVDMLILLYQAKH